MRISADVQQWESLASAMRQRMALLGLTAETLAERSGRSSNHVRAVLGARKETFDVQSLYDLATALGWTPASVHAVLDGGEPTLAVDVRMVPIITGVPAADATRTLTDDDVEAIARRVAQLLADREG